MTILLASLVFSWPHFLFLLEVALNFSKYNCNGGEEEEPCFALRIVHVFVYACEACCGHSSIAFTRRVEKLAILSLVYERMRHRKRSIWSQEQMSGLWNGCCWDHACRKNLGSDEPTTDFIGPWDDFMVHALNNPSINFWIPIVAPVPKKSFAHSRI